MIETKNVFIDASAIISHNFDYARSSLRQLEELGGAGHANVLTTSITLREIESNIRSRIEEAKLALDRFKNKHSILKNLSGPALKPLFEKHDLAEANDELAKQFRDFIQRANAQVIPLEVASADDVFRDYFDKKPPFGDGKKKSEFPDAFVASALENWCAKNNERAYVIATDPDLIKHCQTSERLIHLNRPGEFVDAFLTQDERMRSIEESAGQHAEDIKIAIRKEFENLGFHLDDQEGEVNGVTVKTIELEDDLSLLRVAGGVATFEVVARIGLVADVSYDDMDSAVWDSEDKVSIPLHTVDTEIEHNEEFTLTIELRIDEQGRFKGVVGVHFSVDDVALTAVEDDYYG